MKTILCILFAALLIPALTSRSEAASSLVEKQKAADRSSVDDVKAKIDRMKQEVREKNRSYQVGITTVTKNKVREITGARVPVRIEDDAKTQSKVSRSMFGEFLKRLDRSHRRYFERFSREMEDEKKNDDLSGEDSSSGDNQAVPDNEEQTKPAEDESSPEMNEPEKKEEDTAPKSDDLTDENLPDPSAAHFSWVEKDVTTPVKYQGTCGSCWTFTSAAVMEASINRTYKTALDLSEQNILDCSKGRSGQKVGSCDGGWYGGVFDYYSETNPVAEKNHPYKEKNGLCSKKATEPYRVAAWSYVRPDGGIPDVKEMKEALCKYGPIAACVKVTDHFQCYTGGIYDEFAKTSKPNDINHAITIVGWDDTKQAYLLKNSWGTGWGENGDMWIRYGCNNVGYGAAWVVMEERK